ncbi:uncharacterized protein LOC125765133 [Anopheles funestus]|nr:uncharacterized protein LOC125765133 [Anopheles funestus]
MLFIISCPKLTNDVYKKIELYGVTNKNKKIDVPKKFYLSLQSQFFIVPNVDKNIYDSKELQEDNGKCVPALLRGQPAVCDFIANPAMIEIIHLDMAHILINSAVEFTIKTTCGLKRRNLTGSFLLSYESCNIFLNEEEISSNKTELHGSPLNLPIYELRNEMHQIRLESKSFTWTGWSITSLVSTPIMLMIVICIYFTTKMRKRTIINIHEKPTPRTASSKSQDSEPNVENFHPPTIMEVFRTEPQI